MNTKKGLTGATLKLIACITMFIDHSAAIILERYLDTLAPDSSEYWSVYGIDLLLRLIGRIAFPIFVFMLIEGFTHTRCKWKYALRLFIFALVSEIPFNLGFKNQMFTFAYQNVMFTLLIGFLGIWFIDVIKEKKINAWIGYLAIVLSSLITGAYFCQITWNLLPGFGFVPLRISEFLIILGVIAIITVVVLLIINSKKTFNDLAVLSIGLFTIVALGILADLLNTDYGAIGIFAIGLMYAFRGQNKKAFAFGLVPLTIGSFIEGFAYLDLLFIGHYNGEKGKSNKYAFYLFYPYHILLIHLFAHFVLGL